MTLNLLNVAYPFAEVSGEATGGAEQILASIDQGLVKAGHHSVVLACTGSVVAGELVNLDLPKGTLTAQVREQALLRYRELVERLAVYGGFDVVHFHGVDCPAYLPSSIAPLITLHLPTAWYDPMLWSRRDARFIFVSQAQHEASPFLVNRGFLVENGIDLEAYRPTSAPGRDEYFLGLGRICPEKGFHLALQAAHALDRAFVLAGRVFPYPEHTAYFSQRIAPLLDHKRRFVGPVRGTAKARLLAEAAALVVPSLVAETSSLVTMEALASGTPVVVSAQGALPSLVDPGVTGLVVASPRDWPQALLGVGTLDRAACREQAERRFDRRRMVSRTLELYQRLASASQHRAGAA